MDQNKQPMFQVLPDLMQGILATSVSMNHTISGQLFESMAVTDKPSGKPLSQCDLWQQQFDFYSRKGITAWEGCVPFLVTNSTYMAESYAELIVAFLRDYQDKLDTSEPLYIVELSAGTGRFAFYLLRELLNKREHFAALAELPIRYVMTDITESHVEFWEKHDRLQPYIEAGMLDFAVHRPEDAKQIRLKSGKTLSAGDFKNPVIAIANYLFDTIRHDFFRVENNTLMEGLVTITNKDGTNTANEGVDFSKLDLSVEYSAASGHYYRNPKLNEVLRHYQSLMDNENFIIPIGAFNCIENLRDLSGNNLVLISSDKGYTSAKQLRLFQQHNFSEHGSFSYPVNYDAINRYYADQGKPWFATAGCSTSLHTACYLDVTDAAECAFENVAAVYAQKIGRVQPSTSLLPLHSTARIICCPEPHQEMVTIIIGLMKAAYCEPHLFCEFAPLLLESFHLADKTQVIDILEIMLEAWDNYYYFSGECPLPFWIAQIYEQMGALEECIFFLNQSIKYQGKHESLLFLIGDCQERLNRPDEALQSFYDAIQLKPDFQVAHERFLALAVS